MFALEFRVVFKNNFKKTSGNILPPPPPAYLLSATTFQLNSIILKIILVTK